MLSKRRSREVGAAAGAGSGGSGGCVCLSGSVLCQENSHSFQGWELGAGARPCPASGDLAAEVLGMLTAGLEKRWLETRQEFSEQLPAVLSSVLNPFDPKLALKPWHRRCPLVFAPHGDFRWICSPQELFLAFPAQGLHFSFWPKPGGTKRPGRRILNRIYSLENWPGTAACDCAVAPARA